MTYLQHNLLTNVIKITNYANACLSIDITYPFFNVKTDIKTTNERTLKHV